MFPTNSFLRHLDAAALEELLGQSHRKTYKKGEHIVRFNDTDNNVYVIESGRARVTLFSSEGKEVSFVDLDSGDEDCFDNEEGLARILERNFGQQYAALLPIARKAFRNQQNIAIQCLYIAPATERHGCVELFVDDLERFGHTLFAHCTQAIDPGPADHHALGAEGECLQDVLT